MQAEVIRSQAETIGEWSQMWLREALDGKIEGAGEIGYQLARVARLLRGIGADRPPAVEVELPRALAADGIREG